MSKLPCIGSHRSLYRNLRVFIPLFSIALMVTTGHYTAAQDSSSSLADLTESAPVTNCNVRPDSSKDYVTLGENSEISVFNDARLSTAHLKSNEKLIFHIDENVCTGNLLVIPRGALVHGFVLQCKKAGVLLGRSRILIQLTSLELGGIEYPLFTYPVEVVGNSKTRSTMKKAGTGAAIGTAMELGTVQYLEYSGEINASNAPSGSQILIRTTQLAGVGAGLGTAASAMTPGYQVKIPAESILKFTLTEPLIILPASAKEAAELERNLRSGGPNLYARTKAH